MSKETLSHEVARELEKLNDTIDRKIVRGLSYQREAARHKELTATLRRIREEAQDPTEYGAPRTRRPLRRGTSPVRRRLSGGVWSRLFGFGMAV